MRNSLLAVLLLLAASSGRAMEGFDAGQVMAELVWQNRVLLLFAPGPEDAGLRRQDEILAAVAAGLNERDMVVLRAFADDRVTRNGRHHSESGASFYRKFAVEPGAFRVILVGKDGTVKLDQNAVVSVDDLFQLIDSMPMRRYEMSQDG